MNAESSLIKITSGASGKPDYEKVAIFEYIKKVNSFPILTEGEERGLLVDFFQNKNIEAGHKILNSHLRLVVKIAMQYKKYHASLLDMIAEGNLGLLKALKNFSLEKQVRFSTYAILWVKASIKSFLTSSISSLKIATTNTEKKIMFGLSKVKNYLGIKEIATEQEAKKVASILNVTEKEIKDTEMMLYSATHTTSLNDIIYEDEKSEFGETVSSNEKTTEERVISKNSNLLLRQKILNAINTSLSKRDAEIIKYRILEPEKYTLAELGKKFKISTERVRQVQEKSLKTLKGVLQEDKEISMLISGL